MLYGTLYYLLFNLFIVGILFTNVLKIFNVTTNQLQLPLLLTKYFISTIFFVFLYSFYTVNLLVDFEQSCSNLHLVHLDYSTLALPNNWFHINSSLTNLLQVYYFPFIYVFIVVTLLSIIFCMSYNFDELTSFVSYCVFIFISGITMFFTDSVLVFFLAYEMLLIPSFFILYKFAKTRRCVEAAYLMFFWTQFGALFLILGFLYLVTVSNSYNFSHILLTYFSELEVNFLFTCFVIGFGVKLPIWPFYGWLPKAHVEASTNFSIFLSGVLVKFAFFGLFKLLLTIHLEPTCYLLLPFLLVGITDSVLKIFYQIDLKKLVAYSTVVEMHWLTICIVSGQSNLMVSGFCMLISHALLSTNSFLLVDAIARRFKTRLITELGGLNFLCPKLFLMVLVNTLIFLGFPGSLFFVSEFLFFSFVFDMFPLITFFLLLLLYLLGPTFFFRSWMNLMFGSSTQLMVKVPTDLTSREFIIFSSISISLFWLGLNWQAFII